VPISSEERESTVETAKKIIVLRQPMAITPNTSIVAAPRRICVAPACSIDQLKTLTAFGSLDQSSGLGSITRMPMSPKTSAPKCATKSAVGSQERAERVIGRLL
jgi:hypothetical protein